MAELSIKRITRSESLLILLKMNVDVWIYRWRRVAYVPAIREFEESRINQKLYQISQSKKFPRTLGKRKDHFFMTTPLHCNSLIRINNFFVALRWFRIRFPISRFAVRNKISSRLNLLHHSCALNVHSNPLIPAYGSRRRTISSEHYLMTLNSYRVVVFLNDDDAELFWGKYY